MPHVENKLAALALDEPNYTVNPSREAQTVTAELRTVTATYDGQHFEIEPTPWGTLFKHSSILQSAIRINAYTESAIDNKAKVLPKDVSMIRIQSSRVVPHGAKLVRVWGSDELWQLYFPPQPFAEGLESQKKGEVVGEKEVQADGRKTQTAGEKMGKRINKEEDGGKSEGKPAAQAKASDSKKAHSSTEQGKVEASGSENIKPPALAEMMGQISKSSQEAQATTDSEDAKVKIDHEARWKQPGKFAPDFDLFVKSAKEASGFDEAFFDAYAAEIGPDVTGDDVRLDFCNELADPTLRQLHPDQGDDFWEELWQLGTRDGTLHGTLVSHWSEAVKKEPLIPSQVDEARARRSKDISRMDDYHNAIGQAISETTEDMDLLQTAALFSKPEKRAILSNWDEATWDKFWAIITRKGTLRHAPEDWRNAAEHFEKLEERAKAWSSARKSGKKQAF